MLNGKVIGKDEITDLAVVKAEGISVMRVMCFLMLT